MARCRDRTKGDPSRRSGIQKAEKEKGQQVAGATRCPFLLSEWQSVCRRQRELWVLLLHKAHGDTQIEYDSGNEAKHHDWHADHHVRSTDHKTKRIASSAQIS